MAILLSWVVMVHQPEGANRRSALRPPPSAGQQPRHVDAACLATLRRAVPRHPEASGRSRDDRIALSVIEALEPVISRRWLDPDGGPTPELELRVQDGRTVTVEVTNGTPEETRELIGTANNRTWAAAGLSFRWSVWISDGGEPGRGRRLRTLIGALEGVLREIEAAGGTDREMIKRANERLDPTLYKFWDESWPGDRTPPRSRKELKPWMLTNCDYWFVQDIIDLYTKGWPPRHVYVYQRDPAETAGGEIMTIVSAAEGGVVSDFGELVATLQRCIDNKAAKGQLVGAPGVKRLVVILEDTVAAKQLERAFEWASPDEVSHNQTGLGGVEFPGIDEVWAVAPSFDGEHLYVLRLSGSGANWACMGLRSSDVLGASWYGFH